jgi:hypothetical protein
MLLNHWNSTLKIILVFSFSFGYAFLRYVVFGIFDPPNIFWFVLNKSLSLSAILLIPFLILQSTTLIRFSINILILSHIILNLYLINPDYFPTFFSNEAMINSQGLKVIAAGLLGALFFINALAKYFIDIPRLVNTLLLLITILIHNLFIGSKAWFSWHQWNGKMPPITLTSSLVIIVSIFLILRKLFFKKENS